LSESSARREEEKRTRPKRITPPNKRRKRKNLFKEESAEIGFREKKTQKKLGRAEKGETKGRL